MPEERKPISLDDERLKAAAQQAGADGKTRFEEQREIFEHVNGKGSLAETQSPASQTENPAVVLKNLRTFQGDVAEALKHQNSSVVSIALAEQRRAHGEETPEDTPKRRWGWGKAPEVARITGQVPKKRPLPQIADLESSKPSPVSAVPETSHANPVNVPEKKPLPAPPPVHLPPKVNIVTVPRPKVAPLPPPIKPETTPSLGSMRKSEDRVVFTSPKKPHFEPDFVKNIATIGISILLILLGIGTVVGFYILQRTEPKMADLPPIDRTLLSYNQKVTRDVTVMGRDAFLKEMDTIRKETVLGENELLYIALPEGGGLTSLSTPRLFSILQTQAPGSALRAFGDEFMLGMINIGGNQPFLIIRLSSFENAFDGLLRWESTLNRDLGALFSTRTLSITEYVPEGGVASTTASTTATSVVRILNVDLENERAFEDITIRNKDARVLKNARGDVLLLYSFLDQNTLLITSGPAALSEIMNKIIAEQLVR